MKEKDILKEAKQRLTAAWEYDRENREEAIKDLRFLALDQWPQSVRDQREKDGRPVLTLDHLNQFKNQVVNDIRQAKIALRAVGVDSKSDPDLAELMTGLMRDVQYQSNAPYVYAQAADGQVSCGIGHFRFTTEYCDDSVYDQEIKIKCIPYPLAVYWDPASYSRDRSDANWCFVVDFIPTMTFEERYPKAKKVDVDTPRDEDGTHGLYWSNNDGVLVAEYWKKTPAKRRLAALEDGSTYDITDMSEEELALMPAIVKEREVDGHKVEQFLITGAEVLEGPNDWAGKHIPIVPVIGDEIHLETSCVRKSLIRGARDGQQLYNYWRSAAAELIALAPKSKWLVTTKQIAEFKNQWDTANVSPTPYIQYKPDSEVPEGKPQRIAPPEPPTAIWQEAALIIDDLKAATGIYDASLGAKGNETSGVAIARRQQEGDVSNFHFSDNLTRSLEHAGRVMLDLIPRVYDTERQVRLMGDDEAHSYQTINQMFMGMGGEPILLNDLSKAKFDIRVDIGPSYTTQRLEAATSMLDYARSDPDAMPFMRDLFVKNMDWPGAQQLSERLKKTVPAEVLSDSEKEGMEPQAPPPPDPQVVAQQQKMQLDQQTAAQKLQLEQQKAAHEMQVEEARLAMEQRKFELEQSMAAQKLQLEQAATAQKLQIDQQNAAIKQQGDQQSREFEFQRHGDAMQMEREKHQFERDKTEVPEVEGVIEKLVETMQSVQQATEQAMTQNNQELASALQGFGQEIARALEASKPPPPDPTAVYQQAFTQQEQIESNRQVARAIGEISNSMDGIGDLGKAMVEAANAAKDAAKEAANVASKSKHVEFVRDDAGDVVGADVTVGDD
jgi:hypothetical protein